MDQFIYLHFVFSWIPTTLHFLGVKLRLTTTIPLAGGTGSNLHLAGSHFGMRDHVPLLQTIGVEFIASS